VVRAALTSAGLADNLLQRTVCCAAAAEPQRQPDRGDQVNITYEATLQRTRLLLGLTDGAAVIAWADAQLLQLAVAPPALLDVSLTPASDLSAMRMALLPLAGEPEDPAAVSAVLQEVAADLVAGRRLAADTVSVLRQMRRMLPLPVAVDADLDALIDTLMLAEAGIGASVADAEQAVLAWARGQGAQLRRAAV
jgi:hypothetical protein